MSESTTRKLPPLTLAEWADETQGGDAGSYSDYLRWATGGKQPVPAVAAAPVAERLTTPDGKLIMTLAEWADETQGGDAGSYSEYVKNARATSAAAA